jgi:glycine/D-amino acid oxidase-like deaminating enzyme
VEADLSSSPGESYRRLSLWWDGQPHPIEARPPLGGDIDVDVAVVGGGLTGLWTAFYLVDADPTLRIAVLERDVAGFGASGRNGGWCSALFAVSDQRLAAVAGPAAAMAMRRAMEGTVEEVGRIVESEPIECAFAKGGTVVLARTGVQLQRARDEVTAARARGIDEEDLRFLSAAEASTMVAATDVLGGTYTPHCAAVDPASLVRGLARAVERRGVTIYEQTEVRAISSGVADTARGRVKAATVVRATEGYTRTLQGEARTLVPVYSLMIATEPLPDEFWAAVGLARRETFADHRHLIIYGQRTGDGRMAFGGRGAPYHFGSAIRPRFDRDSDVHESLRRALVDLFPALADASITHRWGGPLGIARDWFPSVGLDEVTGVAWAGGYVGDGVSTTNLAGRTLCDLIMRRRSELITLPWVDRRSRSWEPEPFRYLGINAGLRLAGGADRAEERTGRPTWRSRLLERMLGS